MRRFLTSTSALSLVILMLAGSSCRRLSVGAYCFAPLNMPFTYSSISRLPFFSWTTKAIFSVMPLANLVPTSEPAPVRIKASCVVSLKPTLPAIQSTTVPLRSVTLLQVSSIS